MLVMLVWVVGSFVELLLPLSSLWQRGWICWLIPLSSLWQRGWICWLVLCCCSDKTRGCLDHDGLTVGLGRSNITVSGRHLCVLPRRSQVVIRPSGGHCDLLGRLVLEGARCRCYLIVVVIASFPLIRHVTLETRYISIYSRHSSFFPYCFIRIVILLFYLLLFLLFSRTACLVVLFSFS